MAAHHPDLTVAGAGCQRGAASLSFQHARYHAIAFPAGVANSAQKALLNATCQASRWVDFTHRGRIRNRSPHRAPSPGGSAVDPRRRRATARSFPRASGRQFAVLVTLC